MKKASAPPKNLAKMRQRRSIHLGLIDPDVFEWVDKTLRAAERATSLRVRGGRRLLFTAALYNLMVMGDIRDQAGLERWLLRSWTGEDAS